MGLRDLVKKALRPKAEPINVKTSAAGPVIAFNNVGRPKWTPRRYDTLADEGFRKNVIAYRCAMVVATSAAAIPWLLYDDAGAEMDRHPLLDLLRHTRTVRAGMRITPDQAEQLLDDDLSIAERAVARLVQVPLTDNQFAALVSFVFNVGTSNFERSTLLQLLNRGWYEQVPAQLSRWNRASGELLGGLARRRAAEARLWNTPATPQIPAIPVSSAGEA